MKKILGLVCGIQLVTFSVARPEILKFITFEDSTTQYLRTIGDVNLIYDPQYQPGYIPSFRRQNHGIVSLMFQVQDTLSGVKIGTSLPSQVSSYLVDFYVNIPAQLSSVLGFVIYEALHQNTTTDVKITLVPVGEGYGIEIQHFGGVSLYTSGEILLYPDTIPHPQNWYRVQVYRHNDSVSVFINGIRVDSDFVSLDTTVAESIYIGFENGGSGIVVLDDIIVSTPTSSMHPRLFFTQTDIPSLNAKREDENPGTSGISPGVLWDTIYTRAQRLLVMDTVNFVIQGTPYTYVYPFKWPPPAWTSILYQAYIPQYVQLDGFVYALTNESTFSDRVKNILLTLINWPQWEWAYYYMNPVLLYIETQGFHYMLTVVIGYDLIYGRLNEFERMSVENAILVKGLEQIYLALTVGELGNRPVRHNKQLVGAATAILGSLVLSDTAITQKYLDTAIELIQDYLSDPNEGYDLTTGSAREPIFYAQYAFTHLGMAGWALQKNAYPTFLSTLKPFVQYMSQCQVPGGHEYVPYGDAPRVIDGYMEQFPEFFALIASSQNMPLAQWYLMKNNSYWGVFGQGLTGGYLFFGTFLWLDNTIPLSSPENLNIPFAQGFNTSGISILRTGWDSPTNLFFSIKSRDNNRIHNHFDNNSISLSYNGKWLIGEHPDPYGRASPELHNTLIILSGNDTIRQISGFDRGQIGTTYEDTVILYTEAEAKLSYRLNQGSPPVFLNDYRRSAFLFLEDTLILLMDIVKLPQEYKSRLQFKFHSQGYLTVLPDAFIVDYPDTSSLYSKLWASVPVTLSSYQFDPELGGVILTTDTSVTEFKALYLMKPDIYPAPVDFQVFDYDSLLEVRIDNDTYVYFFDELNAYRYRFISSSPSLHIWTGMIPGIRYWFYVITRDTFLFDSIRSDNSRIGTLSLPPISDTAEIYVYSVQSGTPYPLTYPTTQRKILHSKHKNAVVYNEGDMVFYQEKNGDTWDTPILIDLGRDIAGDILPGTEDPVVVYIGKRLNSQVISLRWGEDFTNSIVIDVINDSSGFQYCYPGLIATSEDSVIVSYGVIENDSVWYLLVHTVVLNVGVVSTDTLDYSDLYGISADELGAPVFLFDVQNLILTWVKPESFGSSIYFSLKDSVWSSPINVSRSNQGLSLSPQVSTSGEIVYFVWEREGNIYFTTYDLGEGRLGSIIAVEDGIDILGAPTFLTTQDILSNKWQERTTIVRYRFNGVGWEFYGNLTQSSNKAQYPQVSKGEGSEFWIVWTEENANGYSLKDTILHANERKYVHGTILQDTTWSDSVFVNGDVTIDVNATLRILPGTVVIAVPNYDFRETGLDPQKTEINVKGKLIAVGTWRMPIVFTSAWGVGTWTGIRIDSGGVDTLKNVYIKGSEVGLWLGENSFTYLDSIKIGGSQEWAIYSYRGVFELYHSDISTDNGKGIYLDNAWATIQDNLIRTKNIGIRLTTSEGFTVIDNNTFIGMGGGIGVDAIKTESTFRLRGNEIQGFDIGVYLLNASVEIVNNIITSEYIALLAGPNSSPIVLENDLLTEYIGVYASYGAIPYLGDEDDGQPGLNTIQSNIYAVINTSLTQHPIMAEMNWWGTESPSPSLFWGEVDYVPFLLSPPRQDYTVDKKENFGSITMLYPIPQLPQNIVRGNVKILLGNVPMNTLLRYSLFDITGRKIKSGTVALKKGNSQVNIPLLRYKGTRVPRGIYFLKISIDNKIVRLWRILNL